CGTRGHAPYKALATHGFLLADDGRKMSKSLNNQVEPQDVIKQNGADILRLWVSSSAYSDDVRVGPEMIKTRTDAYRKLRNTMRFMLGALEGFEETESVAEADMPELERYMLHRLTELDAIVCDGYAKYDFARVWNALFNFCTGDLSALYLDIRKDALYCDPLDSNRRRACRTVLDHVFNNLTRWLAPMLVFTMEEVWQTRYPDEDDSVHLKTFLDVPAAWADQALADKWAKVLKLRRVVTGALEIERREKRIGSSLEAAPTLYVSDPEIAALLPQLDVPELAIVSAAHIGEGEAPTDAFRLSDVPGVAVVPAHAEGEKCDRCWMVLPDVGTNPAHETLCGRCADAVDTLDKGQAA
ncbi:MAG: class I tRNA ligase family protein, partial [Alphaproteobacteria bacterium]